MQMGLSRGFITVATGDYYCWLAQNLAMSYRLFSERKYPFYVITDRGGAHKLEKYFDGLVVLDKPYYTFMDKMLVYQNSPFEETIFIDADANIVDDISFLFDDFLTNSSAVSCVGAFRGIKENDGPIHFGQKAVEKYGLHEYIAFNGGVYYFRKSKQASDCIDFIFSELIPNYDEIGLKYFRKDQMADEPLYGLAMVACGMKPLDSERDIMKLVQSTESLRWDMNRRKCSFIWYGYSVSPIILHYGTHNTFTKRYVDYNSELVCRYKKKMFLLKPIIAKNRVILFWNKIRRSDYREEYKRWIIAHFEHKYYVDKWNRIKQVFR